MRRRLLGLLLLCLALPAATLAEEIGSSAASAIVIDAGNGRALLLHDADTARPMASTTKVMTALLALEKGELTDSVVAGPNAFGVPGTSIYLSQGETLTLEQMLYGLMLASGNDAAVAIAEHIGGTVEDFCRMMTERAAELGCRDTVFRSPHGLPMEGHHTTARDLAIIARQAMRSEDFRRIVSTVHATIPWPGRDYDRQLNNKNRLLTDYEGATGVKTGYTRAAGRCLVFGAEREGLALLGVVLNCADWFDEAERLLDLAFERYEQVTLLRANETVRTLSVLVSGEKTVTAVASGDLSAAVRKGTTATLTLELPETVEAPVRRGDVLGEARMSQGGTLLKAIPLVAMETVDRDDFPTRWRDYVTRWLLPF